ncbi:MAG: hypothetical protein LR008_02460 [Candidatus Pacebacteria bacterium]|nr:hypothetical protein [Candidatus Paceibacterota bacterium]
MNEGIPQNIENKKPSILEQAIEAGPLGHGEAAGFIKALDNWIEGGYDYKQAVNSALNQFNLRGDDQIEYRSLASKYSNLKKAKRSSSKTATKSHPIPIKDMDMGWGPINNEKQRGGDPED